MDREKGGWDGTGEKVTGYGNYKFAWHATGIHFNLSVAERERERTARPQVPCRLQREEFSTIFWVRNF